MIISTNKQALISCKALYNANKALSKSSNKLSSGCKLNSSGDNPGAFALSNRMKAQIKSLEMADRNTNDAISLVQTAEGALSEIENIVQRMRELAVQGATDSVTDEDRTKIQLEIDELVAEVDSISSRCSFNGMPLLDGTYDNRVFQVGQEAGKTITLELMNASAATFGFEDILYETVEDCSDAITICDEAIKTISTFRANLGSFQNRLGYVVDGLQTSIENMKIDLSVIYDTDMAEEMVEYTTQNILVQSGLAMLAQANERPNELLSLLR